MFDVGSVHELSDSPRLSVMKAVFKAIAAGKHADEVWKMTNTATIGLNAIERSRLPDLVRAALEEREKEHNGT
jgi:hypothetical protein